MRSEFEFLRHLRNHFKLSKTGDDCAVLPKTSETDLLITADLLIEDIDFRLEWAKPNDVGHKALAVSLSDVAAMGGTPKFSMISIGIPKKIWKSDFIDKFYEGYIALSKKFGVELVGGDVSKTPDKIAVDSIVLGEVNKGAAVSRSTANIGDLIYVTGNLGGAGAGLKLLEGGERPGQSDFDDLLEKQLTPLPRIEAGIALRKVEIPSAMIDISDGLAGDLRHICKASNTGARIYAEKIPIHGKLLEFSSSFTERLDLALYAGEDFELLFTVDPEKKSEAVLDHAFPIGEITEDVGNIELIRDGKPVDLTAGSYAHF